MTGLGTKLRTYAALGPVNLARVGAYRLGLRTGAHPVQRLRGELPAGPFFGARQSPPKPGAVARQDWRDDGLWFGAHRFPVKDAPDWHMNPFNGARADDAKPWFAITDFDPSVGDIKSIWEASRFDWLLAMAQRAALGDASELARLNDWLQDWANANPPYRGANWKCGQEGSIRVMHLATAALLLDQVRAPLPGLLALVRLHLKRIAPTIGYAVGQQNNHGTSEATALFVGGSWLALSGDRQGELWAKTGLRWLEERALTLIAADGSFSQHSLVYHRVMLDSYALAETWRRHLGRPDFSVALYGRLKAATWWFQQFSDPQTGDGPNYGANDGARIMALTDDDYRDFRPSLQWAAALFLNARALPPPGPWDQPTVWFALGNATEALPAPECRTLDDGGIHVLRYDRATAYLRYPRFHFRPGQADALHVDLWVAGDNILRDAGTYSYNGATADTAYFGGTAAHNTVQFDARDQMPRLGRFLFGDWLKSRNVRPVHQDGEAAAAGAAYRDARGAIHDRTIRLSDGELLCTDCLDGTAEGAVMRWRLRPGVWVLDGNIVSDGQLSISVESDDPGVTLELTTGWESRYYLSRTPLPVLEVKTRVPAILTTRVCF